MRGLFRVALRIYFRRIERYHAERVPARGPVILAANHPSSLTDAFLLATSVRRRVNFIATARLFRRHPVAWALRHCGVIACNRESDDPSKMRSVADTFEACFRVLERGEAVGIFPEGVTHDDPQVRPVKTGAARVALDLEHRHGGRLGLVVVPVGLTYSEKEAYRSDALVHFGEPIRVAEHLEGYETQRRARIHDLTEHIETALRTLVLHVPILQRARLVDSVARLYLDRLRLGNVVVPPHTPPGAEELILRRAIADAVEWAYARRPEAMTGLVRRIDRYERRLARLRISDEDVRELGDEHSLVLGSARWALLAVLGFPVALYGGLHRWLPVTLVHRAVRRFAATDGHRAQTATVKIAAGIVAFGAVYGAFALAVHLLFGWPWSLFYSLSLPPAGLFARAWFRRLSRMRAGLRNVRALVRSRPAARRLLGRRGALLAEIQALRTDYRREVLHVSAAPPV